MSTEEAKRESARGQPGAARIELTAQWDLDGGVITRQPGRDGEPLRQDFCTWAYAHMPEVDSHGNRTTRTNWDAVGAYLRKLGMTPPGREERSALGAPLSDKEGVYTALGASVVTARDNRFGAHEVVRLSRVALVPVTARELLSTRHRDGLNWLEPLKPIEAAAMRRAALRKRDPYRATSLIANIEAGGRVTGITSAEELAIEVVLAATQAYPRAVLDSLNQILSDAEERFALFEPDDLEQEAHSHTSSMLLHLIATVGQLEREMHKVGDDFELRTTLRGIDNPAVDAVQANFKRTLDGLARIRGDARTTVDMIGSTLSSAHLQVARREAKEASEQRERQRQEAERRQAAEAAQREREQRLSRSVALLASVLLIPTLVASVFGADVTLPRENSVWQTWLMFATMVGLGSLSYAALRELDPTRGKAPGPVRFLLYAVPAVAIAAAAAIALGKP
jgi:CorA-like Mg2+ transporter protein